MLGSSKYDRSGDCCVLSGKPFFRAGIYRRREVGRTLECCPMTNEYERGAGFQRGVSMNGSEITSWRYDCDTLDRTNPHA